jgi:hypothetical protein
LPPKPSFTTTGQQRLRNSRPSPVPSRPKEKSSSQSLVAQARATRAATLASPFFPPAIETWEKALLAINISDEASAVRKQAAPRLGFQSPDVSVFFNDNKRHLYLGMWLLCRVPHKSYCAVDATAVGMDKAIWESMPRITKEQWRTFLFRSKQLVAQTPSEPEPQNPDNNGEEDDVAGSSQKPSHTKTKTRKHIIRTLNPYLNGLIDMEESCDTIYWLDQRYPFKTEADLIRIFTPDVTAEILWEICESNFRFELMFLDMVLCPHRWMHIEGADPQETIAYRERALLGIFPSPAEDIRPSYLVTAMPNRNVGLAAEHWASRENPLRAFYLLLCGWPSFPSHLTCRMHNNETATALEESLTKFYCQSFYDTFGRLPTCPRRIPASSSKRTPCIPFIEAAADAAENT